MDCPRCGTPMESGVCPNCGFPVIQIHTDKKKYEKKVRELLNISVKSRQ